jgi:hypothetical protein
LSTQRPAAADDARPLRSWTPEPRLLRLEMFLVERARRNSGPSDDEAARWGCTTHGAAGPLNIGFWTGGHAAEEWDPAARKGGQRAAAAAGAGADACSRAVAVAVAAAAAAAGEW